MLWINHAAETFDLMKKIHLQKAKAQVARPNTIRNINKQIVLNYIRDRAPISRAEIARETALQRSAVSAIVDSLQDSGLIEEIGTGDSTGGRKPTLLKIKTGHPVAIGVDLSPRQTTVAVADLSGKVLEKKSFPTCGEADEMTRRILDSVDGFAKKYKKHNLEVGVSVPGTVDQSAGRVIYVPYFNWHGWDITRQLAARTDLHVTIDNDANAVALAELWFGREKVRNFITVLVGEGVGTGIVFEGQVYRGERGAAGEFGHMIVGERAPVECSCGSHHCWEAHASEKAIIARYRKFSARSAAAVDDITIERLIDLARGGEEAAVRSLRETAGYIGRGISNLIVGLSPQAVIVSGSVTGAWDLIADDLNSMTERSIRDGLPKTLLSASTLGGGPTLVGALSLVLARKFALSI